MSRPLDSRIIVGIERVQSGTKAVYSAGVSDEFGYLFAAVHQSTPGVR
jgi:hypothetical protein